MLRREQNLPTTLNGICPYFTMFPLDFPLDILNCRAKQHDWVLDPFCGRGTTNYACRLFGLPSVGIDSSPVAVAISEAKLARTLPTSIMRAAERILSDIPMPQEVPEGEFWEYAYHREVLPILCRLREGLLLNCRSDARKALRAIILGALHGPRPKMRPAYFSNQAPRTYAPKPRYAIGYWRKHGLVPESVDVLAIIKERAERFFGEETRSAAGTIVCGDSRDARLIARVGVPDQFGWVITSPPYYGLRTYLSDQWLRLWFLGGEPQVNYSMAGQLAHSSPGVFAGELRQVWRNVGKVCAPGARLVIRFGGIRDRKADPLSIISHSIQGSGWEVEVVESAGSAARGRRQALHFSIRQQSPLEEYDIWAVWRS